MQMYQKALRDGFVNVYRGRIFLIGQDRAGKTSLKSHCWVCHLTQKKKALKELTLQSVILMLIEFKTGMSTAKIRFGLKFLLKFQGTLSFKTSIQGKRNDGLKCVLRENCKG